MSCQTEFVLRNDGFWYAPPIDPNDVLDFTLDFSRYFGGRDTIESIINVQATNILIDQQEFTPTAVTVWLKEGILKKIASVTVTVMTVGGRTIERTFKIEVADQ